MVFGQEEDDEEIQLLLDKPSQDALGRSKRLILETRNLGSEVLRSLEGDAEKIQGLKRKQEKASQHLNEANRAARTIEHTELYQFVCVCLALCLVIIGVLTLLIRMIMR